MGDLPMPEGTFATAINCMDGRTQELVTAWLKDKYGVDFVDAITEPGPVLHLSERNGVIIETILGRVRISVDGHGSRVVAIVAHDDCAGNPVSKDVQLRQMHQAIEEVKSWGFIAKVIGLYVNDNTHVELVVE